MTIHACWYIQCRTFAGDFVLCVESQTPSSCARWTSGISFCGSFGAPGTTKSGVRAIGLVEAPGLTTLGATTGFGAAAGLAGEITAVALASLMAVAANGETFTGVPRCGYAAFLPSVSVTAGAPVSTTRVPGSGDWPTTVFAAKPLAAGHAPRESVVLEDPFGEDVGLAANVGDDDHRGLLRGGGHLRGARDREPLLGGPGQRRGREEAQHDERRDPGHKGQTARNPSRHSIGRKRPGVEA